MQINQFAIQNLLDKLNKCQYVLLNQLEWIQNQSANFSNFQMTYNAKNYMEDHLNQQYFTFLYKHLNTENLYSPCFNYEIKNQALNLKDGSTQNSELQNLKCQIQNEVEFKSNESPIQFSIKQKKSALKQKQVKKALDEDYQPDFNQVQARQPKMNSDTKNVIKNFSRAMLTHIIKDREWARMTLLKYQVPQYQFYEYINLLRDRVQNIIQLRQMWTQQHNQFAKVMRILSLEYLRKRHLHHMFNSKIRIIFRSLKYRFKLYQGLKKPSQFITIKDYIKKD